MSVTDRGEEIELIISKVKKQLSRSGDSPLERSYESLQVAEIDNNCQNFLGTSQYFLRCGNRVYS